MSSWFSYYLTPSNMCRYFPGLINRFLSIIGGGWLVFEIIERIVPTIKPFELYFILVLFVLAFLFGLWHVRPIISAKIKDTDVIVTCKICNILKEDGDKVIAVNTIFNTDTSNDLISPNSLQGKFQNMYFRNRIQELNIEIKNALKDEIPINIITDGEKRTAEYCVGTIVKLSIPKRLFHNSFHTYLLALGKSNTYGATQTNPEDFSLALQKLWGFLYKKGHKTKLCIPIIGTGRSGLNLDRITVIKAIIFSFVTYVRNSKIVDELLICVTPEDYKKHSIDFISLQEYLNVTCTNDTLFHSQTKAQNDISTPIS